ncbi:MAG: hypothetical protein LUQ64_02615 [Methanomicrobiales archaeon]|nr:hypothetical protein [Methanomicrobiales archaeon]
MLLLAAIVPPAAAVLTFIEPVRGTFQIGEPVTFSGLNTESDTTYLFLVGPGLDELGTMLSNTEKLARDDHVDSAPVGDGRVWRYTWDTSAAGVDLSEGNFVVYAATRPTDKSEVSGKTYATRRVEFRGRLVPLTTTTAATPTPVPTWTRPPAGVEVQVSSSPTDDTPGKFDGRYLVYESRKSSGDSDIFLYDVVTGTTKAIATGAADQGSPSVSGGWVVYSAYTKQAWNQTDSDLYLYRISSGETTRITLPGNQDEPRISGNLIVWQDQAPGRLTTNLMLQDLTTGTRLTIPTSSSAYRPDISGSRVIFIDRLDTPAIFLYDVLEQTSERITNRTGIQGYPQINGNRVTWADIRGDDADIFVLDVVTGDETQVTEGDGNQFTPSVAGERVAWIDYRSGFFDVYTYNMATGSLSSITDDEARQSDTQVGGCIVAWADDRNGSYDVYYRELEDCTPPPAAEFVSLPGETPAATEIPVTTPVTLRTTATTVPATVPTPATPVPATPAPGFGFAAAAAGLGILVLAKGFRRRE